MVYCLPVLHPVYVSSMSVPLNRRCSGERSSPFIIGFITLKIHRGASGLPGSSPACGRSVLFHLEKVSFIVTRSSGYFHQHVLVHCRWKQLEARWTVVRGDRELRPSRSAPHSTTGDSAHWQRTRGSPASVGRPPAVAPPER